MKIYNENTIMKKKKIDRFQTVNNQISYFFPNIIRDYTINLSTRNKSLKIKKNLSTFKLFLKNFQTPNSQISHFLFET